MMDGGSAATWIDGVMKQSSVFAMIDDRCSVMRDERLTVI
jgi:hypothetical protein